MSSKCERADEAAGSRSCLAPASSAMGSMARRSSSNGHPAALLSLFSPAVSGGRCGCSLYRTMVPLWVKELAEIGLALPCLMGKRITVTVTVTIPRLAARTTHNAQWGNESLHRETDPEERASSPEERCKHTFYKKFTRVGNTKIGSRASPNRITQNHLHKPY